MYVGNITTDLLAAVEFESRDGPELGEIVSHLVLVEPVRDVTQIDDASLARGREAFLRVLVVCDFFILLFSLSTLALHL